MQKVSTGDFRLFAVDAGQVISQVLTQYSSMPGIKAVLRSDVPPDCKVIANDFLYDVFVNLAGNAVKHGGPEIFIDIKAVRATIEGKDYIRFTFEDNGQGIPDDMKEDIFKRLQRGNTAANGKGLGLYLVKTLVDNYKGQVWAENRVASDYTKGSRFVVLLQAA